MNSYHTVPVHVNAESLQKLLVDQDDTIPNPNTNIILG
jgi:hypothetical protein